MNIVEKAIIFAVKSHEGKCRKGKTHPYILHPLEAMIISGSLTDDEEVLAAAVLHDTVEDTETTVEDLVREFGPRVAGIVAAESENKRKEKSAAETWTIRKEEAINTLKAGNHDEKIVCLGDKLSNIRDLARDYALIGDQVWQRFNQKDKALHCWYYTSIFEILEEEFGNVPAICEYRTLLMEIFGKTA